MKFHNIVLGSSCAGSGSLVGGGTSQSLVTRFWMSVVRNLKVHVISNLHLVFI